MTQQSSNLTNWIISFFLETDPNPELQEFSTPAATRKDAYLAFWAIHDNPDIIIASCMQESVREAGVRAKEGITKRIKDSIVFFDEYKNDLSPEAISALRKAYESESIYLPTQIHTEDEMLIRAVYGVAALWVQDSEYLFNQMSQGIHLIAQHSMRMTLLTGEHPTPQADTELYTYLRDAAMFFDFVANGDNAVLKEADVFRTANPYFSDLLNA